LDELQRLAASRCGLMPIFLDLLEHDDRDRRYFAVFQLGELALRGATLAPVVIDALLARASDPDAAVRTQLAHTLEKLTPGDRAHTGVQPTLEQLVKDDSAEVRERADAALRAKRG
ncbi:MAG TPA: HEAT repeat domain-containing protein, partial [Terrimicrobiaceae bacterium]